MLVFPYGAYSGAAAIHEEGDGGRLSSCIMYTPLLDGRYAQNQLRSFLMLTGRCTAPTTRHTLRASSMRFTNNRAGGQLCTIKNSSSSRLLNCCNMAEVLLFYSCTRQMTSLRLGSGMVIVIFMV